MHPTNLAAIKRAAKDDLEGKSLVACLISVNCRNVCSLVYAGHSKNGGSGGNSSAARAGEAAVAYSKGGIEGMRQTKAFKLLKMSNCNTISACFNRYHTLPVLVYEEPSKKALPFRWRAHNRLVRKASRVRSQHDVREQHAQAVSSVAVAAYRHWRWRCRRRRRPKSAAVLMRADEISFEEGGDVHECRLVL